MKEFKKARCITAFLLLAMLFSSGPLLGANNEEASTLFPKETELMVALNLGNFENYSFPIELVQSLKNFRMLNEYLGEFQHEFGFSVTRDFFSWQKGSIYLGFVRTGSESPVGEMLTHSRNVGALTICKINLYEIAGRLDEYYMDNERYPASLDQLGERYMEKIPSCPTGCEYEYSTDSGGTRFTLSCAHKGSSPGSPGIVYSSEKGLKARELSEESEVFPAPNMMVIIPIRNLDTARSFLDKIMARFEERDHVTFDTSSYEGFTLFTPRSRIRAHFAIGRGFFYISDNIDVIKTSIDTLIKKRPSINENSRYLSHARKYPDNCAFRLFIDIMKIMEGSSEPLSADPWKLEFLKSCETLSLWADIERKKIRGESILTFIPGKITDRLKVITQYPGKKGLPELIMTFPSTISNFMALNVDEILSLFGAFTIPSKHMSLSAYTKELINRKLNLSWEEDIKPATTGRIGVSYEVGEILADTLFSKLQAPRGGKSLTRCGENLSEIADAVDSYAMTHNRLPASLDELDPGVLAGLPHCPAGGRYIYEKKGDHEYSLYCHQNAHIGEGVSGDSPCYSSSEGLLRYRPENQEDFLASPSIPFVIGFELISRSSAQSILQKLVKKQTFSQADYKEKKIYIATDSSIAYSYIGNFLFIETGGNVPHKLEKIIDAEINGKKSLSSLASFRRFQDRMSGTILFIRYDRVDWISSLLRGFLLLAGSDFRDWANAAGEFEDSWSSVTVHERDIRVCFEISGN